MSTNSWCAVDALRIRVSMSATGSVIYMLLLLNDLPTRLHNAWQLPSKRHLPKANPTQSELSDEGPWAPTNVTAIPMLHGEPWRPQALCNFTLFRHRS